MPLIALKFVLNYIRLPSRLCKNMKYLILVKHKKNFFNFFYSNAIELFNIFTVLSYYTGQHSYKARYIIDKFNINWTFISLIIIDVKNNKYIVTFFLSLTMQSVQICQLFALHKMYHVPYTQFNFLNLSIIYLSV